VTAASGGDDPPSPDRRDEPAQPAAATGQPGEAAPRASESAALAGESAARISEPAPPAPRDAERELRAAVGVAPRPRGAGSTEQDIDEPPRWTSRRILIAAAAGVVVVGVGILVVAGQINRDRYVLTCEAERAVPEQGRSVPPWGTRAMTGEPWRPLAITRETRCRPLDTDDVLVLERAYLAMVIGQAAELLTAREVTKLDAAEALLQQALLLSRPPVTEPPPLAKQRSEQHELVERMLGDVAYGRATAKLREAAAALGEAARLYDTAATQRPRYTSDAAAASAYVRALARELHTGALGATVAGPATSGAPRDDAPIDAATAGSATGAARPAPGITGSGATTASSAGPAGPGASTAVVAPGNTAPGDSTAAVASGSAAPGSSSAPSVPGSPIPGGAAASPPGSPAPGSTAAASPPGSTAASAPGSLAASASAGPSAPGAAPGNVTAASGNAGSIANGSGAAPPAAAATPLAERAPAHGGAPAAPDRAPAAPPDAGVAVGGVLL